MRQKRLKKFRRESTEGRGNPTGLPGGGETWVAFPWSGTAFLAKWNSWANPLNLQVKGLVQGHTAGRWQTWNSNLGSLARECMLFLCSVLEMNEM